MTEAGKAIDGVIKEIAAIEYEMMTVGRLMAKAVDDKSYTAMGVWGAEMSRLKGLRFDLAYENGLNSFYK